LFCLLQKIKFYTDVEQIAAIGIQCAESGHNTECSYVLVGSIHVTTIALQMSKINQDQSYNTLRKPRDNLGKLVTLGTQDTGRRQTKHKNHVGGPMCS
jgi:hypothetical protein